jgi:SAM-dependent methyltransferase
MDKAGPEYWNQSWSASELPDLVDPRAPGLDNFVQRRFHALFEALLARQETRGKRLIEFGCARSTWLPYFAAEFGFDVSGIDYSQAGCEQARAILRRANLPGQVTRADFFTPPVELEARFDFGVSFGVAEHFQDTAACITAFSRFLRTGGRLLTVVPNMAGAGGLLQKLLSRAVFDIHVPLDAPLLIAAHERAGFEVERGGYFLSTHFGVCNLNGVPENTWMWRFKRLTLTLLTRLSMVAWLAEERLGSLAGTPLPWIQRIFSPYVYCWAVKK